jgi:hypothetical protein
MKLSGGLTSAACFQATMADGRSVFVKVGHGDSADEVRHEARVLRWLHADFAPAIVGLVDTDVPVLICEDLGAARGNAPTSIAETDGLLEAIGRIAGVEPAAWLPRASPRPPDAWGPLADRPEVAVRLGQDPTHWPELVSTMQAAQLHEWDCDSLVHGDLAYGNWCVTERGWVFTDWAATRLADSRLDLVIAAVRLRAAGLEVNLDLEDLPGMVTLIAGLLLRELTDPALPQKAVPSKQADAAAAYVWASTLAE